MLIHCLLLLPSFVCTLISFFFGGGGGGERGSKDHQKRAIIGHTGGPIMAHCWMLTWQLCDFQGIRTSIMRKPNKFVIFQGGGRVRNPCPLLWIRTLRWSRLFYLNYLPDILRLLVSCGSSSRCLGLDCSRWLWYCLIIHTYSLEQNIATNVDGIK